MTCSHNTTLGFGDFDYYKISSYMIYTTSGPKRILIDQSNQRFRLEPGDVFGVRFPHFGPTAALKTSSSGSTLFYSSSMVNDTNSTTLRGNRFPLTAESPSQMSYTPAIAFFYSIDSESKLEHVYQNIGHAKVLTSIGNSTTRVNDTMSICLQEDIKGLQSYFPEVFPFGEAVNVTGGISQGSNVTFYWDFGDKNNATSLIPWVTHVFNHTVSLKTVSIIAGNNIRVEAVWCTVLVQERILGLQFKDTTLLSIENGTTAEIAWILLNGSHVDFTLNITYPDGFIVSKNLTNVKAPAAIFFGKYNTTLTQPGWYRIEITASNRLDNVTLVGNLSVQRVVHGVTMDSPKILKTNQTFHFTIPPHQGDEVRYLLNTMDGNIINTTERLIPFNYIKAGRYDAYLIASNDISSVAVKCGQIIVQDEVKDLKWSANYTKLNVDYSGECSNFVRQNDTFPFDYAVAFSASANGTNVSYTWSFPEDVNNTNSSCTHKFKEEGKNQIVQIVLTAENAVSSETKNISLKLVKDILNVSFVNDGPSTQNSQVNFTLSMTRKGEGSFFHIDFKDSSIKKKIFKSPKSTYRLDGQDAGEVRENQTFGVTYKNVGKYPVSLHARNNVSCVYQVSEVAVARGFCTYPVISVPGFEEGEPRKFKRSEKISIKTDTKLNCFNYSTTLRWEIYQKCDGQQPIPVTELLKNKGIDVDRSELLIPARFFNYCREVEARFTVNMTEAPGVSKVKTIKFEITESPLRAIIYGGSERTVGNNRLVEIDATDSYDPDAKTRERTDQNWKFAWFCHRINESYTLPANLTDLPPPVPTPEPPTDGRGNVSTVNATNGTGKDLGGCFRSGPGRLNFSSLKITFRTSKMKPKTSYAIIFAMHKEGREMQNTTQQIDVKPGDPPTLTIK